MICQYKHTFSERPLIKELSKQVGDKVVEKYKSGLGYKKISKSLMIPRSTIKSIIFKWKDDDTTTNLPREGRPPKLTRPGSKGSTLKFSVILFVVCFTIKKKYIYIQSCRHVL